ncbi:TonB-dependent receptor [Novosphingobium sp. Gsoil 351]|uniref:TonB-dependent receptor n=1 Tax=Novosphingobium sp. Gsoil 351 TaxID=2675225 RepID=UPI0018A7FC3E|nr:TonB-dependent receptor [Novosphingobium sp. Gsoil 351]
MASSARNTRKNPIVRNGLLASSAMLAAMILPQAAFAQDATAPQASEDADVPQGEIIVTARKQNETLQEVPVTIAVVSGKTLDDYHATKAEDVASRVPTLNVQVGGSGSGGTIALRGVGSSAISASFDSAIAFDFDGIQVSTMRLVQAGFYDVGQIEVLKGPQSLYYGKSASAGVFSIKSADPTRTWEYGAKASYEFEEKGKVFGAYLSGPISDTLGIRIAGQYTDIDRYQRLQANTPAVHNPRRLKDFVGRVTLNWEPSDRFTANLKAQYVRNENDGAIAQSDIFCGVNGRADEVYLLSGVVAIPAGYDCKVGNGKYFTPDTAPPLASSVPLPSKAAGFNGVPFGKTDLYFSRLRMDYDVTDALKVTSVSGYVDLNAQDVDNYSYSGIGPAFSPLGNALGLPLAALAPALGAINGPGVPLGVGTSDPVNKLRQFSQELRIQSDFDGPLNFMVGGFYEDRKFTFDTAQQAVNISLIGPDVTRNLQGGGQAIGTGYTFDYKKIHITKTKAYSVFGSLTYKPTDQLEISGGLRYTDEKKVNTIYVPYVNNRLAYVETSPGSGIYKPSPVFLQSGFRSGPIRFKDSNVSPEATIKYKVSPDFNVFASYKTGFKSGGIDNSALPSNSLSQAALTGNFGALIYKSEKSKGGEIGFKSQLADRTFTLNGTVYYYNFTNLQIQIFNATAVQFITLNAGKATTKGAELELGWRSPVEGLNFSANLAYLDAKYKKFILPGPDVVLGTADDVNLSGRKLSRAPKFAGNVAFDYKVPVGDTMALGLGANVVYSGRYITNNARRTDYVQKSFATIDGRISFGERDDRWKIALVGVNLADKIVTQTSGDRPFLAPANGFGVPVGDDIILNQNRGRQVYVEGSVKF